MANVTLEQINENVLKVQKEIAQVKNEIRVLKDTDPDVRPEYLKKLNRIEKGKFLSSEDFDKEMAD